LNCEMGRYAIVVWEKQRIEATAKPPGSISLSGTRGRGREGFRNQFAPGTISPSAVRVVRPGAVGAKGRIISHRSVTEANS
jgi:hypothetical protein